MAIDKPAYIRVEAKWANDQQRENSLMGLSQSMRRELGEQYAKSQVDAPRIVLVTDPMEIGAIRVD